MTVNNFVQLIVLAALWGASFIFMRVISPVLGPIATADMRVLIAGIVLVVYFYLTKHPMNWRDNWKAYLFIGSINSAIPFLFYSYAALHLPASYLAILNSTAPLFGVLISSIWLDEELTLKKILGLLTGTAGVVLITQTGSISIGTNQVLAILACLGAAFSYAATGVYIKLKASGLKPKSIAGGSQLLAGLVLFPFIAIAPPQGEITLLITVNVLVLAIFCSGLAYLLYYNLIKNIGPTKALTVTFLIPLFAILWGIIFLNEKINSTMYIGCGLIIIGTVLVLGVNFLPKVIKNNSL
ncbi:MAG: EamA family transporter [Halobacteriovoraceae bacterium]|jgi:drug/metabolite transporter (DMT)-like permease|nr:EamA family transporter [Halobacteriovoraceae bacterium]